MRRRMVAVDIVGLMPSRARVRRPPIGNLALHRLFWDNPGFGGFGRTQTQVDRAQLRP